MTTLRNSILLKEITTCSDIWDLFCTWRKNSKNTIKECKEFCTNNSLENENLNFSCNDEKGNSENVETIYLAEKKLLGIKYTQKQKNGETYITTIVFNGNVKKIKPNLSIEMEYLNTTGNVIYKFNKPKFIDMLEPFMLEGIYHKNGQTVTENNINEISEIINGKSNYFLPLVYLSYNNGAQRDMADEIAKKLYGMAYIVYETSRDTTNNMRYLTNESNPYNGAIGIYWKENGRRYCNFDSYDHLIKEISKRLSVKVLPNELTWLYLQTTENELQREKSLEIQKKLNEQITNSKKAEELLENLKSIINEKDKEIELQKKQIDDLKEELTKKQNELNDYILDFDSEIDEKDKLIEELRKEKEKLSEENETYKNSWERKEFKKEITLNISCKEKELFPDEICGWLKAEIYNLVKKNTQTICKTRKYDVAKSILDNNSSFDYECSENKKKYFQEENEIYKENTHPKSFVLKNGSNHDVYSYHGDERYCLTFGKTPGDGRSPKNLAANYRNTCTLVPSK